MNIYRISIENYRSIRDLEFYPNKTRNLLIGANNAGKTTILQALDLVLDPGKPHYRDDFFDRYDFFEGKTRNSAGEPIQIHIEIWFNQLTLSQASLFTPYLEGVDDDGNFQVSSESPKEFDASHSIVRMGLRCQEESDGIFTSEVFYPKTGDRVTKSDREAIGFFFIPSWRNPLKELTFKRNTIWSRLFAELDLSTPLRKLMDNLQSIREILNENEGFAENFNRFRKELVAMQLIEDNMESIDLGLLSLNGKRVMGGLDLLVKIQGENRLPLEYQGLGIQNLILIGAILQLAEKTGESNLIFAFEEPEQNLEPHMQQWVGERLLNTYGDEGRVQSFITTHSQAVAKSVSPEAIKIVQKSERDNHRVIGLKNACDENELKTFEREELSSALFSEVVFLVEGPSELGGLPVYLRKLRQEGSFVGLASLGVVFVNCNGIKRIPKFARFFNSIEKPIIALVDHDGDSQEQKQSRKEIYGECDYVIQHANHDIANDYEGVIAWQASISELKAALCEICEHRKLRNIREFIINRLDNYLEDQYDDQRRAILDSVNLDDIFNIVEQVDSTHVTTRWLMKILMGDKKSPMSCKSVRQSRLVAKYVGEGSVPDAFRQITEKLESFCKDELPDGESKYVISY